MIVKPMLSARVKKDGTQNIVIYLYHGASKMKTLIKTDYYVKDSEWVGLVKKSNAHHSYINAKLKNICIEIETYCMKNETLLPNQVKEWYEGPRVSFNPVSYYMHYMEMCKNGKILKKHSKTRMSYNYIKALKTSYNYLESYSKIAPVAFEIINEDWYNKFVSFMRSDIDLKQNTIAKAIKHIKIICAHALKNNVHSNNLYKDYVISTDKPQKIRLTPDEVDAILKLDLSEHPELVNEQERFAVAYNLILRFGDSVAISDKNIIKKNGRFFLRTFTQKTRKEIMLPIKDSVYKILKSNNFQMKGVNARSNKKLKVLGMMAGINDKVTITEFQYGLKTEKVFYKYELIETHTTRRSAARNLFDAGMEPEIIRVLGGWSTMKQMLEYIDIDLDYAASKAADHPFFK